MEHSLAVGEYICQWGYASPVGVSLGSKGLYLVTSVSRPWRFISCHREYVSAVEVYILSPGVCLGSGGLYLVSASVSRQWRFVSREWEYVLRMESSFGIYPLPGVYPVIVWKGTWFGNITSEGSFRPCVVNCIRTNSMRTMKIFVE